MGCLKSLGVFITSAILYIINSLLLIIGIVIFIKGIYYICNQQEYIDTCTTVKLELDDVIGEVGMVYMVPAAVMISYSCIGLLGAGRKVVYLVLYLAATVLLIGAYIYGICTLGSDNNKFSPYSYLNKVHNSLDPKNITGFVYLEFGLQIALLVSCVYLIVVHYSKKKPLTEYLEVNTQQARRAQEENTQKARPAEEENIQKARRAQEEEASAQKALLEAEGQKLSPALDGLKIYVTVRPTS